MVLGCYAVVNYIYSTQKLGTFIRSFYTQHILYCFKQIAIRSDLAEVVASKKRRLLYDIDIGYNEFEVILHLHGEVCKEENCWYYLKKKYNLKSNASY